MRAIPAALLLAARLVSAPVEGPAADVKLAVHTRDNASTFQVGQVIELELSFTSTKPKTYQIDMATYDRSGRLNTETFAVVPQSGWEDPLKLYFHSWGGFFGGGLRNSEVLSAEPTSIHLDLNEWVQFTQPGQYRVTVTSSRVSPLGDMAGRAGIRVASNELMITIAPADAAWQGRVLANAVEALNGPKPGQGGDLEWRRRAVKQLRYLRTPAAAREMARRMKEPDLTFECALGIAASPARDAALEEMTRMLRDPEVPIDSQFLSIMAIAALAAHAEGDIPAQRVALEDRFRQELAAVLPTKRNQAFAVSAATVVERAVTSSATSDQKRKAAELVTATFEKLPAEKQAELLLYRWQDLDHQAMLPLLRQVARRYQDVPNPQEMTAYWSNKASAAALSYWVEMEPQAARAAVLEEILRPKPRFDASVLGILPDQELAQAGQPLVEHLRDNGGPWSDNIASLIHRYANRAVEPQVTAYLDGRIGSHNCKTQAALLAYLLKQDPENARSRLEAAMQPQLHMGCNTSLLEDVAKLQNHPMLQKMAVRALDDPAPRVASGAALYLTDFGSPGAEKALWERFTRWSQKWMGHEDDIRYFPGQDMERVWEGGLGSNLMRALAAGQGWLADEASLRQLIALSVGPQQRDQAEGYLKAWQERHWDIQFTGFEQGQANFQIAQYHAISLDAAKAKLRQFPRGSKFRWHGVPDQDQKVFQELSTFAAGLGMEITRVP